MTERNQERPTLSGRVYGAKAGTAYPANGRKRMGNAGCAGALLPFRSIPSILPFPSIPFLPFHSFLPSISFHFHSVSIPSIPSFHSIHSFHPFHSVKFIQFQFSSSTSIQPSFHNSTAWHWLTLRQGGFGSAPRWLWALVARWALGHRTLFHLLPFTDIHGAHLPSAPGGGNTRRWLAVPCWLPLLHSLRGVRHSILVAASVTGSSYLAPHRRTAITLLGMSPS